MSDPEQPRWGAPQLPLAGPGYDPRSPEWRDPGAQPWWDNRNGPPPAGFPPPAPPPGPSHTKLFVALGVAVVLLIVLGVSLAATRGSSKQDPTISSTIPLPVQSELPSPGILPDSAAPTDDTDPVSVTKAYYAELAAKHPTAAFSLLCSARQQSMPLSLYTQAYAQDVSTGTGITTFTQSGQQEEQGNQAAVPGTLVLADKESVPITVLLMKEGASWRVCSSDLGGVLPNPGMGSSGSSGGVTT